MEKKELELGKRNGGKRRERRGKRERKREEKERHVPEMPSKTVSSLTAALGHQTFAPLAMCYNNKPGCPMEDVWKPKWHHASDN